MAGLGLLAWRKPRAPEDDGDDEAEGREPSAEASDDDAGEAQGDDDRDSEWLRELAGAGRPPHPG
jgi:hypothetical protein